MRPYGWVVVVDTRIREQEKNETEGVRLIDFSGLFDAARRMFGQLRQMLFRAGHARRRYTEDAELGHGVERRKDHLTDQAAGHR